MQNVQKEIDVFSALAVPSRASRIASVMENKLVVRIVNRQKLEQGARHVGGCCWIPSCVTHVYWTCVLRVRFGGDFQNSPLLRKLTPQNSI